jgi:hypothetical protein
LAVCTSSAITIDLTFNDTVLPSYDPKGDQLKKLVQAAANQWADILEDKHVLEIEFGYQDLDSSKLGLATITETVGGRPTKAQMAFDTKTNPKAGAPQDRLWFFDPTPADHSEFEMQQTLVRDLTPAAKNLFLDGSPRDLLEVGYRGEALPAAPAAARDGYDMLTVAMHEIGHTLGFLGPVSAGETADNVYDVDPLNTGLMPMGVKVFNDSGVFDGEHLRCVDCLMFDTSAAGTRTFPSAADVFALATAPSNPWSSIDLQRKDFWGGVFWSTNLNWAGNDLPDSSDMVFVRHGGTVQLDDVGHGRFLEVSEGSRIRLIDGSLGVNDAIVERTNDITPRISSEGDSEFMVYRDLELRGGDARGQGGSIIANRIITSAVDGVDGRLTGFGLVRVSMAINSTDAGLVNDGTIRPEGGTLTLRSQHAEPRLDLDGKSGDGKLDVTAGNLLVEDELTDAFDGKATIGADRSVEFATPWQLGTTGVLEFAGGATSADAALLEGPSTVWDGKVMATGYGRASSAETEIGKLAQIQVAPTGTLEIDGKTTFADGAQVALESGGRMYLDGPTELKGASFTGDGEVIFHGPLTVSFPTTINAEIADLDGRLELGAAQTHKLHSTLTLNVADIELPGSQAGFGHDTLEINGIQGRLNVNLNGGSKNWTVHESGTLDINGNNLLEATHLNGSLIRLNGTALVNNLSRWVAPVDVAGTVTLETAGTKLRLTSVEPSAIRASASVSGPGQLIVGQAGTLQLEQGAHVETSLLNDGRLEPGVAIGAALVSEYEQSGFGTLAVEIGGTTPGTQFDVLQVSDAAKIDGALEVSLANAFLPVHWNTFDVLTTTKGLTGTFDELALPANFNHLKLDVEYLPLGARVRTIAALLGDADADGDVDLNDFGVLKANFGLAGWGIAGDVDYDEDIDLNDFGLLKDNFGVSAAAVPEPSTWLLAALGFVGLSCSRRRIRFGAAAAAIAAMFVAAPAAQAIDRSWNTDSDHWSEAGNWTPNGVPANGDVVWIGNLPIAYDATVFMDQDDTIAGLNISDGMGLQTQGHWLVVNGDTTIGADSRLNLTDAGPGGEFETDDLRLLGEGARLWLTDSYARINGQLELDQGQIGQLSSNSSLIELYSAGTTIINDGTLRGGPGTMSYLQYNGGVFDLDGKSGNGRLFVSGTSEATLSFLVGGLTDAFSGEIELGPFANLVMNVSGGWEMDAGSKLTVFGTLQDGSAAHLDGSHVDLAGQIDMGATSDHLIVEADATVRSTAQFELRGKLEFDGETTFASGATVAIEPEGRLYLDGATKLQGATFTGDGQVIFQGPVTVTSATTINAEVADLDGRLELGAGKTHVLNAALTLNVADIEAPGSQEGFGLSTIEINGIMGRLNVNLNGGSKSWTVHETGTLDINGNNLLEGTHLDGSALRLNGKALVNNRSRWNAQVDVAGTLTLESAGTQLRFMSAAANTVRASAAVTGPGLLIVGQPALLRLEQGANVQTALRNDGRLEPGVSFGTAIVSQFEQTDTGTLAIEIGGTTPGTQHDVLQVADAAQVAGKLEVSLAGGFLPVHWNTFDVLTTTKGLAGEFDELALPADFNHLKLDVQYLPLGARVRTIAALLGDADADGDVDLNDFGVLKANFGTAGWGIAGDVDYDEDIDLNDFGLLKDNFGKSAAAAVPEPSGWLLAALGAIAIAMRRCWRVHSGGRRVGEVHTARRIPC